jgi:hypothetical protein
MPKDRKQTFSDRQSQASRGKKQAAKEIVLHVELIPVDQIPAHVLAKKEVLGKNQEKPPRKRDDFSQATARIVTQATEK